jgi:hypothetical protein
MNKQIFQNFILDGTLFSQQLTISFFDVNDSLDVRQWYKTDMFIWFATTQLHSMQAAGCVGTFQGVECP